MNSLTIAQQLRAAWAAVSVVSTPTMPPAASVPPDVRQKAGTEPMRYGGTREPLVETDAQELVPRQLMPESELCQTVPAEGDGTKPCRRCGSEHWYDVGISGGRIRRDCRRCGAFIDFVKWYL